MKILVVDDDKNICELLNIYLQNEGYEVVFAYDGSAAINSAKKERVVLTKSPVCAMIKAETDAGGC